MHRLFCLLLFFCLQAVQAQSPQRLNATAIHQEIKKLNFLGSALYLGAHPDDENTRLIALLSNKEHARTAYLSLTRGDGGQNLIGPQLREQLGVIRTRELLAAREIDGGEQFFTRANDFGYSKNPEETLELWDKEKVLSDIVWTIRTFRPDVIINRFDHRSPGKTHGHHTTSAMLSLEAFDLAGDEQAFADQLEYTSSFQPKRLFFNTSFWFYGSQEAFEAADKSSMFSLDAGTFYPQKGLSNTEIAALSRSQHRSQGFGSTGTRGSAPEYLELIKGTMPKDNLFEGIDTSWNRVKGGQAIGRILKKVEEDFAFNDPAAAIPALLEAYRLIEELEDPHWREQKSSQIKKIIAACAGLFLEAVAQAPTATPGEQLSLQLEAINRSDYPIRLLGVNPGQYGTPLSISQSLSNNTAWTRKVDYRIPSEENYTTPYWLEEAPGTGMYQVADQQLIGLPERPEKHQVTFSLDFDGTRIDLERPVAYKFNDPVFGETYRPFAIIPELSVEFEKDILIFKDSTSQRLRIHLSAGAEDLQGTLHLKADSGWYISPSQANFRLTQKGSTTSLNFRITPPEHQQESHITALARVGKKTFTQQALTIDYEHIPRQFLVQPVRLKASRLEIRKKGDHIGYIEGAGDVVPESLEQIGYRVTRLNPNRISGASLTSYDAIVVGIRAYNTVEALKYRQASLLEYVRQGGTLILQYNTSQGMVLDNPAPYPLEFSRDRVTDERAPVRFLAPDHPVLNTPNKITPADFDHWVQERGLYFPSGWSAEFTPILSMNDKGETPKEGSLLIARYGEGYFVYTGLSFFRQFPAGVPGAYRLFANLVSLGQQ